MSLSARGGVVSGFVALAVGVFVAGASASTRLSRLPAATFHFRLVDEQVGATYGADQTSTMAAVPPIPPLVCGCLLKLVRPTISTVRQSQSSWGLGSRLAHITKNKPPVGTTFSFALNEPATVKFAFTQKAAGHNVGGTCIAQTNTNRHGHARKPAVTCGALKFTGHAGTNKVSFQGRISRAKKLQPGTYTLIITATNILSSSPKQLSFTIVK
jgi:hypothetical protein